ncbi:Archaeal PaREP1/PaREP8 family protein [uncultured archaeon]|nr:Archaeal PaREP1/PaREP8 family protein [uncultured archaeon]
MEPEEILSEIVKRKELYLHYLHNSEKNFILGNISKSSEFLWGALHTLVYSIAITYKKKLSKHGQIRDFAKELSATEKNENIFNGVVLGEMLHSNFYHNFLDKEQFKIKKEEVEKLMSILEKILEKRVGLINIEQKGEEMG